MLTLEQTFHPDSCLETLRLKWSWACRVMDPSEPYTLQEGDSPEAPPEPGDVALVRVDRVSNHSKLTLSGQMRLRLYEGDVLVGVFGNRYATDAFEGEVQGTAQLHMLTGAGMIGTACSRRRGLKPPTELSFLGYLADESGARVNLKRRAFAPKQPQRDVRNVVLVVGSGMNSGKTTAAAKLTKALLGRGLRVSACKLTGSVSHNDLFELSSTLPCDARDFSDYGFPSTYLCDEGELLQLFDTMLADALASDPHAVVMEVADGVLQRETMLLLEDERVRRRVGALVLASPSAPAALHGVGHLARLGYDVTAVSGVITNSALSMREFEAHRERPVPLASSADDGGALAERVVSRLQEQKQGEAQPHTSAHDQPETVSRQA